MEHEVVVGRVYTVVEYSPNACFKDFADTIVDARRQADAMPHLAIIGNTQKLIGCSIYGSVLMRKDLHSDVIYCRTHQEVYKHINNKTFKQLNEISDNFFRNRKIVMDLPIQLGFFVLQYAKLKMLSFYYDCIDKFTARENFELCLMDTDSLYLTLCDPSLEAIVKPEMLNLFNEQKDMWFPKTSPPTEADYSKRTPGLFKVECRADAIVALCAKTYCTHRYENGRKYTKFSCKGINKK